MEDAGPMMEQWYKCPKCNQGLLYGTAPCYHCKCSLTWSQQGPILDIPPNNEVQRQIVQPSLEVPQLQLVQSDVNLQTAEKTTNPLTVILAIVGGGLLLIFGTCSICMGLSVSKPSTTPPIPVQTPYTVPPNTNTDNTPVTSIPTNKSSQQNSCSGATAICGDGTCSYSINRTGTCSGHGGVKQWINQPRN